MLATKLLAYYQRELSTLKKYGKAFALQFPKVAHRLGLSEGSSEDPHIERLIESFSLISAQIQLRLDEDMPETTDALLTVMAPQFARPFPSVCIVQMEPDVKVGALTESNVIAAKTALYSKTDSGRTCKFRTSYPVNLLPVNLNHAGLQLDEEEMIWRLTLQLQVWPGAIFSGESVRLFLNGSNAMVNIIYTLLCSEVMSFSLLHQQQSYDLSPQGIRAVGFAENENLLATDSRVSPIHSLLLDYFLFPQKFHFIDLLLPPGFAANSQSKLTFVIKFNRGSTARQLETMAASVDESLFKLHCTPAINLFEQRAEPIAPLHQIAEYPVVPDIRHQDSIEVWSIDRVQALCKQGNDTQSRTIYPLFGLDHSGLSTENNIFWQAMRRESIHDGAITSALFIAFSDRSEQPLLPESDIISLQLTCTNGDLPSTLLNGNPGGDFESENPLAGVKINALTRPTRVVNAATKQGARWRLISQMSLNHMLFSGPEGTRVLKETLALYNITEKPSVQRLINLIQQVESRPVTARLVKNDPHSLARGVEITITFSRDAEQEVEYFLLCRFIDGLLALYAPVNSFSRVITCIDSVEGSTRDWPVSAGRLSWI
ncbi:MULTISPECIES: type VI secretion system baseplate subunit TssF [Yersinia]|uniref:type VI secretion system baseplate subunit TssF n=1 Tax=Yersinia TaxID=629 RepID=UPI0011A6D8B8|nr:type VI secretion system baseplate subunit TssF [Yersinia kristensenii]MBW5812524.1 type VI secretion system baseplate subunit TssF [Yersinia kristensenii]MBW5817903.1 type VI secretion system baseplate subunit TssF [Yersinia kristensenii]MBW5829825.1 type VI secretion system baseplate subunit TssF [Yersinia kristensenii]MBW5842219.1 type VI secretion system baseplate subunit TssF [Yersinia kristensenii]MDA5490321.1 type VI secretion system baseplate subunit TssF [Yersinia kristensenii]